MYFTDDGIVSERTKHPLNAPFAIESTEGGIFIVVIYEP